MRTLSRFLVLAIVLGFLVAGPARAVTNGVLDGTGHPNVGYGLNVTPRGRVFAIPTGVLIADDVVLEPGETAWGVQSLIEFGAHVYVGFGSQRDPNQTDPLLFEVDHAVWDPGLFTHPNSDNPTLGVLILKAHVVGITPAQLPVAGRLDALSSQNGLRGQSFTIVGYGSEGRMPPEIVQGMPLFEAYDTEPRMTTTGEFMAVGPRRLIISSNPTLDDGGGCYGDFGPVFLGASNELMAIVGSFDPVCRAVNFGTRTDTPQARAFLSQFPQINLP